METTQINLTEGKVGEQVNKDGYNELPYPRLMSVYKDRTFRIRNVDVIGGEDFRYALIETDNYIVKTSSRIIIDKLISPPSKVGKLAVCGIRRSQSGQEYHYITFVENEYHVQTNN